MHDALNHRTLDAATIRSRKLPVQADFERDEEGEMHLRGSVTCPTNGSMALERCTACLHCHGVLFEPRGGPPMVLCSWGGARAERGDAGNTAGACVGRPALAVTAEVPVKELAQLMIEYDTEALLVVSAKGAPLGVVTERDVLRSVLAGNGDRQALGTMQPLDAIASEHAPMADVGALMADRGLRTLPLADDAGQVLAMLTEADALRWAIAERNPLLPTSEAGAPRPQPSAPTCDRWGHVLRP